MPGYSMIRAYPESERTRVLERLLALRSALDAGVAAARPDSLLLATWNLRDFDSNKFQQGPRLRETFHYLAEIIARFDLVAIQEVNRDLGPLKRLMALLGRDWDYLVTGVTEGDGGNSERMAFVFNAKRVRFTSLAGQVVLPKTRLVDSGAASGEGLQFARAPYLASFQAGWFKFNLATVHIYFGSESGAQLARRVSEIEKIARHFRDLQKKESAIPGQAVDYILLGDFNIVSPEHQTMQALRKNGFEVPDALQGFRTNLGKDKYYDQIAFRPHDRRLELGRAGVFDFREAVYRPEDYGEYHDAMPAAHRDFHQRGSKKGQARTEDEKRGYYNREWITWQMSDHLLLWVELKVDFTNEYLDSLRPGRVPLAG